ncbi:DUF6798 domain-containing protein [Capilliphycus salinus ALCB114379]|uniref:DUF6798 domain-containing protein n=1 Tax=Capilliphycus salinus TaxID=2768948 RepID=UPI0039A4ECF7
MIFGLILGVSYVQEPLYTSNQNTKFLQGLAKAGLGYLDRDWLANTLDPLPVFTELVWFTSAFLHPYFFYLYYIILFGVYVYSLLGIAETVFKFNTPVKKIVYLVFIVTLHCLQIRIFDFKTHVYLHYGVAEQYILGDYFQTSNFGVLILLSIHLFLREKIVLSVFALAGAATVHPAYLPSAALLTLSYLIILYTKKRRFQPIFLVGGLSFLLALPVTLYMFFVFQPTTPEIAELAKSLIVNRIPHHSFPTAWFNSIAFVQILVIILAIYLVRKTRLFVILGVPFAFATVATVLQLLIKNNTLGFITPWRVSAFLVPLSSCLIWAAILGNIFDKNYPVLQKHQKSILFVSLIILSIYVFVGAEDQIRELENRPDYANVMDFVKTNRQPEDLYLVPHTSGNFIEFRLYTGVPILANYKSHPYKDIEVIEWHNRLMMAQRFYSPDFRETRCQALEEAVKAYPITHVITELGDINPCPGWTQIYDDQRYKVYKPLPIAPGN